MLRAIILFQCTTANPPLMTQRSPHEHGNHTLLRNARNHRTYPININATPVHVAGPLSSVNAAPFPPNQPMENPAFYPLNSTGDVTKVSDSHILSSSDYLLPGSHPFQPIPNSISVRTMTMIPSVPVRPAIPVFFSTRDSVYAP
jgi:hypothetical protein